MASDIFGFVFYRINIEGQKAKNMIGDIYIHVYTYIRRKLRGIRKW